MNGPSGHNVGGGERYGLAFRVAKRLARARSARGLSQETLAARLGMAVKNLQRIESGKQNLSLGTIERICTALNFEPEIVLAGPVGIHGPRPIPGALERLAEAGLAVRAGTERGRRPSGAVPVTTLSAAAGSITGSARTTEVLGWVTLPRAFAPPEGQFVAEVRGASMEPKIPSGSLCLFGRAAPGELAGRILVVTHASLEDTELGGPYALKRVHSTRRLRDGRTRVTLESINPDYAPIVVDTSEGDELRVIAEFLRVLVA